MDEAVRFFGNAMRLSGEIIELMARELDDATIEVVADALGSGHRIVMLSDPTGIVIALLNPATGRVGPLIASVNALGREKVYGQRTTAQTGRADACVMQCDPCDGPALAARALRA